MAKINSVKKSKKPSKPLVVRPLAECYSYHSEFREKLCSILSQPIYEELKRRDMTIKQFCADMKAGGYSYSYDGMRQALIGRNYNANLMYWSNIYAMLGIHLPDVWDNKV